VQGRIADVNFFGDYAYLAAVNEPDCQDGGYVQLDVTDPTKAKYLADSDFKNPDPEALQSGFTVEPEGNAHEAEFSLKVPTFPCRVVVLR
jgi:hypothetical protein